MRKITALVDHELIATKPKAFAGEYEIRFGDERVATLRFPRLLTSTATAESGDGAWTFDPVGFLRPRTIIRQRDSNREIGVYRLSVLKGGGTLELPDGRRFAIVSNLWRSSFELGTMEGETLVRMERRSLLRFTASVRMYRSALGNPELPWMVMLLLYVLAMTGRGVGQHATVGLRG